MSPLALDIVKGRVYLAVVILSQELCREYDEPPNGIVYFVWDGRQWQRLNEDQFPTGNKANLLANPWGNTRSKDASGFVRNETKHLFPANRRVNQPIEEIKSTRWLGLDACAALKEREQRRRLPAQKQNG
jgi:hypothetical protein